MDKCVIVGNSNNMTIVSLHIPFTEHVYTEAYVHMRATSVL